MQVGDDGNSFMVEARQMVDPFDAGIARKNGKGGEGVIVYEVETPDINRDASCVSPLIHLKTPAALAPGTSFASGTGLIVQVIGALPGGYSVIIDDTTLPWTSVSEGASTPGAPVSAVVTGEDRVALFLADPNGGIYTTSGSAATGWEPWTSVSEGASTPGAPVSAVVTGEDRVALFAADPNGGIYTTTKFQLNQAADGSGS